MFPLLVAGGVKSRLYAHSKLQYVDFDSAFSAPFSFLFRDSVNCARAVLQLQGSEARLRICYYTSSLSSKPLLRFLLISRSNTVT